MRNPNPRALLRLLQAGPLDFGKQNRRTKRQLRMLGDLNLVTFRNQWERKPLPWLVPKLWRLVFLSVIGQAALDGALPAAEKPEVPK